MNDKESARLLCESKVLPERLSEYEPLAAKGYKQYLFSQERTKKQTGTKEVNGVVARSDLKSTEFDEVAEHIKGSMASGAQPKTSDQGARNARKKKGRRPSRPEVLASAN